MKMTNQQLRELDAWIAENVMGWLFNRHGIAFSPWIKDDKEDWKKEDKIPHYTTDPAAAMEVLKKCKDKIEISIFGNGVSALIRSQYEINDVLELSAKAETLELAIALFARKLFSK